MFGPLDPAGGYSLECFVEYVQKKSDHHPAGNLLATRKLRSVIIPDQTGVPSGRVRLPSDWAIRELIFFELNDFEPKVAVSVAACGDFAAHSLQLPIKWVQFESAAITIDQDGGRC